MKSIYLLPLGHADRSVLRQVCRPLGDAFRASVELKEIAIDVLQFYDEGRLQYNSTDIIRYLQEHYKEIAGLQPKDHPSPKLLAVSGEDLFIPILTYVFGEAQLDGACAIVSYHRLPNERYGLPPDPDLFLSRFIKESLHELGHSFGLIHCIAQECVMHASTYVEDIDLKGETFCPQCRRELQSKE